MTTIIEVTQTHRSVILNTNNLNVHLLNDRCENASDHVLNPDSRPAITGQLTLSINHRDSTPLNTKVLNEDHPQHRLLSPSSREQLQLSEGGHPYDP
jgi:hypothetical protein